MQQKRADNKFGILTAVKNGQEYGDNDHCHLEMDHIGVGVVDLAGGEVQQPSVLTLQHQLQREQSPQAQPLSLRKTRKKMRLHKISPVVEQLLKVPWSP